MARMKRLVLLLAAMPLFAQSPERAVGIGNFIHVVADLDKTMAFYGDVLGLERTGAPGPRAFSPNDLVEKLYDARGSQSRVAVFKIPGSPIGLEFVEFKGIPQTPFRPDPAGTGAMKLRLVIPNAAAVMSKLNRAAGGTVQDPDGFNVEISAGGGLPAELTAVAGTAGKPHEFFRDLMEFHVSGSASAGHSAPAIHDPGVGLIRVLVRDVDASLAALKSAGATVVSANGEAAVAGTRHYAILRDPDGFFFQLFPAPPAAAK